MTDATEDRLARIRSLLQLWRPFIAHSRAFWSVILRHRALIAELVRRDLQGGHAGHGFGSVWIYLQPLAILITLMLIFGVVIGTKIPQTATFPGDYTSYILVGLVPWFLMANALGRAPSVFANNASLVKQVVFPIETLPIASAIACFMVFTPSYALLLAYKLLMGGGLPSTIVLLPIVLAIHALLIIGLMLMLSVVTPFVRDVREIVTMYVAISMYLTPAIYLPDWVPRLLLPILYLNPFSYVVWVYQDVLFFGRIAHPVAWIVFAGMAFAAFAGGLFVFRKVRLYLGNVL